MVQASIAVKESHPTGIDESKSGKDFPAKQSPEILIQEANVRELPTPDMLLDGHVHPFTTYEDTLENFYDLNKDMSFASIKGETSEVSNLNIRVPMAVNSRNTYTRVISTNRVKRPDTSLVDYKNV